VERLFRSGQRRALATVHELDREWNRLLYWISEPKLNHDGRTDHRNGDFYSLIGREFYARGPEIKSARALVSGEIVSTRFHWSSSTRTSVGA